ncbi:MAG: proline--tRNA ligase [Betaproteobacteria bacterium]|jgi:prolyl-tRNA synthetase|nr:proline--tRNA ligase [Betaproteobacteria bacterium]
MRISQFHFQTLKEDPSDAEVISHKLMLRASMIRRLGAGIYNYMPLGLRVIRKVENIIREEMNRAGAIELLMPLVQPAELWQETGRWEKMGPELLRVKDRHGREFAIQPTSEEVITDIARQELKSWRQLPKNFYHIQTKFRDERRPRFGVMRGREFTMKDAYSFDRDVAGAERSYDAMFACYRQIFNRLGLRYRAVAADTGAIGGSRSHEFQVIAETGEDAIVYCPSSDFAANMELAEAVALLSERALPNEPMQQVATPGKSTCAEVAALIGVPLNRTVKSIVLATDSTNEQGAAAVTQLWLLLLRGDHDLNEVKVGKIEGLNQGFRFANVDEIDHHFGCKPGYLGPVNLKGSVRVIADRTVAQMSDFVTGANQWDHHLRGVNWGRDLPEPACIVDIRNVVEGDPSPDGRGVLAIQRGIEVGHIFYLGTKYSEAMKATYLDETGKPALMQMGCYGIGVTRIVGAAIEQNHDDRGIAWPAAIAPFEAVICPVGAAKSELVRAESEAIYQTLLAAGVDVALDDRDERPGAMFADWELIGVPVRITVGERSLKEGKLELLRRTGMVSSICDRDQVGAAVKTLLAATA